MANASQPLKRLQSSLLTQILLLRIIFALFALLFDRVLVSISMDLVVPDQSPRLDAGVVT